MPRLLSPILSALFFVLLFGAAGIALDAAWVPGWASIDAAAVALPPQLELTARPARRCPHCGWIESMRKILPDVAHPHALQNYEYTVRKSDGSSSVFQEALPGRWRLGERLIYINGAGRPAALVAADIPSN